MMSKHLDNTHLQAGRQLILVAGELNHVVGRLLEYSSGTARHCDMPLQRPFVVGPERSP